MDTNNTTERIDQRHEIVAGHHHELSQVPGRGHQTQPEKDQRVRRTLADAGDRAAPRHWLRQGVKDRALRHGQRSYVKGRRFEVAFVTEAEFDRVVDSKKMVRPYVAARLADAGTA
jgi:hypothetical protein